MQGSFVKDGVLRFPQSATPNGFFVPNTDVGALEMLIAKMANVAAASVVTFGESTKGKKEELEMGVANPDGTINTQVVICCLSTPVDDAEVLANIMKEIAKRLSSDAYAIKIGYLKSGTGELTFLT